VFFILARDLLEDASNGTLQSCVAAANFLPRPNLMKPPPGYVPVSRQSSLCGPAIAELMGPMEVSKVMGVCRRLEDLRPNGVFSGQFHARRILPVFVHP